MYRTVCRMFLWPSHSYSARVSCLSLAAAGQLRTGGLQRCLPQSNGMDAPTLNGINVPKWMCLATTKTDRSVRHEDYNGRD